jgi:hypothetical protein
MPTAASAVRSAATVQEAAVRGACGRGGRYELWQQPAGEEGVLEAEEETAESPLKSQAEGGAGSQTEQQALVPKQRTGMLSVQTHAFMRMIFSKHSFHNTDVDLLIFTIAS